MGVDSRNHLFAPGLSPGWCHFHPLCLQSEMESSFPRHLTSSTLSLILACLAYPLCLQSEIECPVPQALPQMPPPGGSI